MNRDASETARAQNKKTWRGDVFLYAVGVVVGWLMGLTVAVLMLRGVPTPTRNQLIESGFKYEVLWTGHTIPTELVPWIALLGGTATVFWFIKDRQDGAVPDFMR